MVAMTVRTHNKRPAHFGRFFFVQFEFDNKL